MKKHILCLGDSNTHGYCADPADCADGGIRFNEEERWTCRLQAALGPDYLVTEEGLSGRTTVFVDPLHESMDALSVLYPLLKSHEFLDLLVIMLGTNDVKERFGVNAVCIGLGMERLLQWAKSILLGRQSAQHPGGSAAAHWGRLLRPRYGRGLRGALPRRSRTAAAGSTAQWRAFCGCRCL